MESTSTTQSEWPACQRMLLLRPGGTKRDSDSETPSRILKVLPRTSRARSWRVSLAMFLLIVVQVFNLHVQAGKPALELFHGWNVAGGRGDFAGLYAVICFLHPRDRGRVAFHPQ